jgi:predicted DNA-binding transcriptional regulator AlpA
MPKSPFLSTAQLAALVGVKATTVLRSHSKNGHFNGVRPLKMNRLLRWPSSEVDRLLTAGYTPKNN